MATQYFEVYGHYGVRPNDPDIMSYSSSLLYSTNVESDNFVVASPVKREINKAGSFEFDILPTHSDYVRMYKYSTYISVEEVDNGIRSVIFYGKIIDVTIDFNNIKHASCEGILSDLLDYPMFNPDPDSDPDERSLQEKFNDMSFYPPTSAYAVSFLAFKLITDREDIIGSTSIQDVPYYGRVIEEGGCINTTIGDFIKSQLLDAFGGYLKTTYTRNNSGQIISRITWCDDPLSSHFIGSVSNQTIELGLNLLSFEREYSNSDPVTGLVVVAQIKESSSSDPDAEPEEKTVIDIRSKEKDGRTYSVPGYIGDNTVLKAITMPPTDSWSEAYDMAVAYRQRYHSYDFTKFDKFTVKAIDLHYFGRPTLPKLEIGNMIRLISSDHNIDRVLWCTSKELDINNQLNNVYVLSDFRPEVSSNDKALTYMLKR